MFNIEKITEFLTDNNSAVLITSSENRRYISGFLSSSGAVVVTASAVYLLVDFRYIESAQKSVDKDIKVLEYKNLPCTLNEIFKDNNIKTIYIERDRVTLKEYENFKSNLNVQIDNEKDLSKHLLELRAIKTDGEIKKIIEAQRITEKSYLEVLNYLKPGIEERQIAIELEHLIKKNGAERVAFDLITISGKNTSLPHGEPSNNIVKAGDFFTFDIGAVFEGYHSDMTRTVAIGYADDEMKEIYDIVLSAHKKACAAIKDGALCSDVDIAARDYIAKKGYGEYFGHSTGHGVGLEIHEMPIVFKTNKTVLKENMIITDEPGIYLPGKFGVRIEDMFKVTKNGAKSLADIDKDLIIV